MINALIDTNVIIDSLAARKPFNNESDTIFDLIKSGEITGYITASSVTDIYYLLNKAIGYDLCQKAITNLLDAFEVITVTKSDCQNALKSAIKDYEDALVAECADKAGLDYIITRDNKFLNYPHTISPTELIKQIKAQELRL